MGGKSDIEQADGDLPMPWDRPAIRAFIADPANKRGKLADLYKQQLVYDTGNVDWLAINAALRKRYTRAGLCWIKNRAWKSLYPES